METEYTKEARDKNEISKMDIPYGLLSSTLVTLNRLIYYVAWFYYYKVPYHYYYSDVA